MISTEFSEDSLFTGWHVGQQQRYYAPLLSVLGQLLNGPPGAKEGLKFPFYSSTTGVLGSPSFPLLLWC